jgi:hypothetical protein
VEPLASFKNFFTHRKSDVWYNALEMSRRCTHLSGGKQHSFSATAEGFLAWAGILPSAFGCFDLIARWIKSDSRLAFSHSKANLVQTA